jgi:hypothetical protein
MTIKKRLSASVDDGLLRLAESAVREGRAPNVSHWVNDALRMKAEHERALAAMDELIASYEAEHGKITDADVRAANRWADARAIRVRGRGSVVARRKGKRVA